jgi:hypothetical protein
MKNKTYDIFIYLFSWTMLNVTAKNTHEVWAAQLHPCLVAYEDLPESEKEYDGYSVSWHGGFFVNMSYYQANFNGVSIVIGPSSRQIGT